MIGWYVHHHGRGHRTRAAAIAAHLDEQVTVLSSLEPEPAEAHLRWVQLARDDEGGSPADATAGGLLHWAPRGDAGLRDRMSAIVDWAREHRPSVVVVDVSVEVTLLVRLLGVPVVVMAMPGDRTDAPHTAAYTVAQHIVAPWSRSVYDPTWLRPFAGKTTWAGAISRFAYRAAEDHIERTATGVVLGGTGGSTVTAAQVEALPDAVPELAWEVLGPGGRWVTDPWPVLRAADVVVTHAGQNAIADVAAAQAPAVIVAQERPFGEQQATADALARAGLAVALPRWPDGPVAWRAAVDAAREIGGTGWSRWAPPDAARCAADAIAAVAA